MGQLGGKSVRTLVTSLEILSDDGEHVLMVDSVDGLGGGGVKFRVRRPWDSTWGSGFPTFTVAARDADVVAKLVGNTDAQYVRTALDAIDSSDFRRDNPNPPEPSEEKLDCTQLDIERAKAANLAEERALLSAQLVRDHTLDKHITASITGCEMCEEADAAARRPYEYDLSDASAAVQRDAIEELPFEA